MNNPSDIELTHQGAAAPAGAKKRLRVYQNWQGNERFFCWGYLVAGPNWKASFGTAALILAPTGIYLAFVAPYMGLHVHAIILVISCVLPVLAVLFLMLTACRDPGIIPRQEPDQEYLSGQKPRTKEVYVNNQRVVIRYNDTCHFYQPPRAHHCSVNDNCIERFDHHCPWVGTTIGLRNYRTFLLFVYTSTVLCLYVFGVCVAMLFVKHSQLVDEAREAGEETGGLWGKAVGKCIPALALMGYTFLFFWFVGGLSAFHAYLVGTNQTTYENFRYNHDNRPNPYSRGILRNCLEVWFAPTPPSKVRFRAFVDEVTPPTGQPHSPYLNGASWAAAGPGDDAAAAAAAAAAGPDPLEHIGGGDGGSNGGGGMAMAPAEVSAHAMAPPYPHTHMQGYGMGSGGEYGGQGLGSGGAGDDYDPAALHQQPPRGPMAAAAGGGGGNPLYGMPGAYGQPAAVAVRTGSYSDAGGGWAAGGGPNNEPPAHVNSYGAFTSQAGPGGEAAPPLTPSRGGAAAAAGGSGYGHSPAQAQGGRYGHGHSGGGGGYPGHERGQHAAYGSGGGGGGGQPYYDDEREEVYDDDDDVYDEYDVGEDELQYEGGQGEEEGYHGHQGHQRQPRGGGGVPRPEHGGPAALR